MMQFMYLLNWKLRIYNGKRKTYGLVSEVIVVVVETFLIWKLFFVFPIKLFVFDRPLPPGLSPGVP